MTTDPVRDNRAAPLSTAALHAGLSRSGMSQHKLWADYCSMGGVLSENQLNEALLGGRALGAYNHNMAAQALNDHFVEQGHNHPVPYFDELGPYPG